MNKNVDSKPAMPFDQYGISIIELEQKPELLYQVDGEGNTVLMLACMRDRVDIVFYAIKILEGKEDLLSCKNLRGESTWDVAVRHGSIRCLRELAGTDTYRDRPLPEVLLTKHVCEQCLSGALVSPDMARRHIDWAWESDLYVLCPTDWISTSIYAMPPVECPYRLEHVVSIPKKREV